jgi:hypothetical protein
VRAGARVFGLGGISGGTLLNTVGSLTWGKDLNGVPVTNWATFQAAVALLRTPSGHSLTATWANPPVFAKVEVTLATTDTSAPSEEVRACARSR